jgi:hypothetical protein
VSWQFEVIENFSMLAGNPEGNKSWEDTGVVERLIVKLIICRQYMSAWSGLNWLRI